MQHIAGRVSALVHSLPGMPAQYDLVPVVDDEPDYGVRLVVTDVTWRGKVDLTSRFYRFSTSMSMNEVLGDFFFPLTLVPIRPARPVPKRSMVAGSGTGAGSP